MPLWDLLFNETDATPETAWKRHALEWFSRHVNDSATARFPVIEANGENVSAAIGTLELGVPNPYCPRGRTARLANVMTLPTHRGRGFGTALVLDVISWARSVSADRVDLSATVEGRRLYAKLGFVETSAPRMKLVL